MKTILKAAAVVICAALLIWNASQLKAIEAGTKEVPIEYNQYIAEDAVGEYREAKILGLIPFAVEENQQKYGSQIMSTKVVAYYCLAILEDYSTGAVKLTATNEQLVGYDEWIIETEEDYINILLSEGFTIRGKTETMPHFDSDTIGSILDGSYDFESSFEEEQELNQSLDGITLLNTIGVFPDSETVVPDLSSLDGAEGIVIVVMVVAALWFAWDLLKIYMEKSAIKKALLIQSQASQGNAIPTGGSANNHTGELIKEYTRVLMECSSAPVGDPTQAAEYAMGKINYFRGKGLPEKDLYHLEISVCTNIPSYVIANYQKVIETFQFDATPFWAATENLINQGKMDEAYAISKPFVDYIKQNQNTLVTGKHFFQSFIEDCLYRTENGFTMQTPIDLTKGNFVGLLVAHAKLVQQMSITKPELKGVGAVYLDIAKKLSNVNASVYLVTAQGIDQDESLWKANIDKALLYCHEADDLYGIAQIYYHMGLHYMAHQNDQLSAACLTLAIHYAGQETTGLCNYLLSKTANGKALQLHEAIAILCDNQIQVGYGAPVKNIATVLAQNPNAQPLVKHIVEDRVETGQTPVVNPAPFSGVEPGETGVLLNPHLVRLSNNEFIPIAKNLFRIGKEHGYVDYCVDDNSAVSRSHAVIINQNGEFFVQDTNSTNHTYINDVMIQAGEAIVLNHGDTIRLANEAFIFNLH